MNKYELTDETHPTRPQLHRIRALRNIPETGVKRGDLGGWIESEGNLSQVSGTAWVSGTARVFGTAQVFDNAHVSGTAQVFDNARVFESRHVITIGPVGSEDRTVTIHRIVDGGHRIAAGCWAGTADQLAERITDAWPDADPGERKAWKADYKTIIKLARKRAAEWESE